MKKNILLDTDVINLESQNIEYAGLGYRFLANILDRILVFIIMILCPQIIMPLTSWALRLTAENSNLGLLMYLLAMPLFLTIYNTIFESTKMQGSPAKYLLKLKVTGTNHERISPLKALARNLGKFISAIILCYGYIMIQTTKQKQGLHDILAKTYVIRKNGH